MFDFGLFLWDLLASIFSILENNPWFSILGKIIAFVLKKIRDWYAANRNQANLFESDRKSKANDAKDPNG